MTYYFEVIQATAAICSGALADYPVDFAAIQLVLMGNLPSDGP